MFEVGFSEILLILGLALLVLGPEKLPGLAAKIGRWTGRARAMARQLQTQLEQEVTLDELAKSKPKPGSSTDTDPAHQTSSEQPGPPWTQPQNDHSPDPTAGHDTFAAETHTTDAPPADAAAQNDSAADSAAADSATTKTGQ